MDFTLSVYRKLLTKLKDYNRFIIPFIEYINTRPGQFIILRHDVDRLPGNSLKFAEIQAHLDIKGTYYFRCVEAPLDEDIIRKIAGLGHEIGYHYEDLSIVAQRKTIKLKRQMLFEKDLVEIANEQFVINLEKLRKIAPVSTICMHGSPLSGWDSRLLWKYYDYKDFGIVGEPYFDIDFDEVLYFTDTGRRWDGERVSMRDKAHGTTRRAQDSQTIALAKVWRRAESAERRAQGEGQKDLADNPYSDWKVKPVKYRFPAPSTPQPATRNPQPAPRFHSTFDIIKASNEDILPQKIMMTFHPQRWTDKPFPWLKEFFLQNAKNVVKFYLVNNSH